MSTSTPKEEVKQGMEEGQSQSSTVPDGSVVSSTVVSGGDNVVPPATEQLTEPPLTPVTPAMIHSISPAATTVVVQQPQALHGAMR